MGEQCGQETPTRGYHCRSGFGLHETKTSASNEEGEDAEVHDTAARNAVADRAADAGELADDENTVKPRRVYDPLLPTRGVPEGWEPPPVKTHKGEPEFESVDNPGDWNRFVFAPKFDTKGTKRYKYHALPSGAMPVPPQEGNGARIDHLWEFFYQGWKKPENLPPDRHGATLENLFPEQRKGSLDVDMLKKLGMKKTTVTECDPLFFYQLLHKSYEIFWQSCVTFFFGM